jgi:curli biogenesis system outer membrane secretion channel CsgG
MIRRTCVLVLSALLATACASESSRVVATQPVESYGTNYSGPVTSIALGKIANASPYMRGIFTTGDQLGGQAKTILKTHLTQTGRFDVLDRDNLDEIAFESETAGASQDLLGARYVITGEVTEFGRKQTGDEQLFGILGRGKTQTAYSKVSLNVVDVKTSRVVCAVQGAGEYELESREVLGTGGTQGYDSTLNGKVLNLSITDAVNKLVRDIDAGKVKLQLPR